MDIQAFFPARYAEQADGLMNIMGGGLTRVKVDNWPFSFRSLAIVAKILLDRSEALVPHTLSVRLLDPAGASFFETGDFEVPSGNATEEAPFYNINLALVLANVEFPAAGRYWFELLFDRKMIKRTPMLLEAPSVALSPTPTTEGGDK
jgi:hypothetical protein